MSAHTSRRSSAAAAGPTPSRAPIEREAAAIRSGIAPAAWAAWLVTLLIASPFAWPLLRAGVYVGNGTDLTSYQVPMRRLVQATLAAFELPIWNPWMLAGVPLLGAWQLGILYPPAWPGMALGAWAGVDAGLVLDLERAGHGLWLVCGGLALGNALRAGPLLRPTVSGLAVALLLAGSGVSWGHVYAGHTSFLAVWAWLPWVWALTLRALDRRSARAAWAGAGALALALLAGHPQLVLIGGVGLVVAVVGWSLRGPGPQGAPQGFDRWRRDAGRALVLAVGLIGAAAALAAAQLLPTAALVDDLNRSLDNGGKLGLAFSPPVASLLTLLAPEGFGAPEARTMGFSWHESVGALAPALLALAVAGAVRRPAWVWLLGALALVAFVPGSNLPVLEPCIDAVPPLGAFRVPSRWWVAVTLLLALPLADVVAHWATIRPAGAARRPRARIAGTVAVGLAALGVVALAMSLSSQTPWWVDALATTVAPSARAPLAASAQIALLWAGLEFAVIAGGVALPQLRRPLLALGLVAAAVHGAALAASVQPASRMWPAARLRWPQDLARALREAPGPGLGDGVAQRIVSAPALRQTNWGGGDGVRIVGGYETAMPVWTNRYFNRSNGRPQDRYLVNLQLRRPSPWLDRAAVAALLHSADDRGTARSFAAWPRSSQVGDRVLQRNPAAWPRIGVVRTTRVEPDRAAAIDALGTLADGTVLLDRALAGGGDASGAASAPAAAGGVDTIGVLHDGGRSLELDATLAQPGVLVVRDAMAPGWNATIDGAPTEIAIADGLFRAIALPAGSHRVRMWYEPPGWIAGVLMSAAAWLAWIGAGLWLRRRSHQRPA